MSPPTRTYSEGMQAGGGALALATRNADSYNPKPRRPFGARRLLPLVLTESENARRGEISGLSFEVSVDGQTLHWGHRQKCNRVRRALTLCNHYMKNPKPKHFKSSSTSSALNA